MKVINVLVVLAVIGFTAYLGIMFGKPIFMYRALKADVKDMTRMTVFNSNSEFRQAILDKAEEYGLKIAPRNVRIMGSPGEYKVSINWTEMVYLFEKKYEFSFEVP
jgi:hypothetical protein